MRKKKKMLFCTLVFCCILSACGQKKEEKPEKPHPAAEAPEKEKDKDADKKEKGEKDTDKTEKKKTEEKQEVKTAPKVEKTEAERLIQDQTFDTELTPLGNVRFASYAPDTTQSPYGDAEFKLLQNQQVITVLSGMNQSNTRKEETFHKVEAVSFRDYNQDGYTDIIIICSYIPDDRTKSVYSEARLYFGSAEGSFTLDVDLSEQVNGEVVEKTIQSILDSIYQDADSTANAQTDVPEDSQTDTAWKQAYADYIRNSYDQGVAGYQLIYVDDDDIPELAVIGICEAAGSRIITYANGQIYEKQLCRTYFTYIERENLLCNSDGVMDGYYDLVYCIIDGQLTLIAEGNYGAEDHTNLQQDENGNLIYKYFWNGIEMTEEDYNSALNEVYDTSKAKQGYELGAYDTVEEILEKLES